MFRTTSKVRRALRALLLALCCQAQAQDAATGALNGVVVDAAGHPLAGVALLLRNVATGRTSAVSTDRLGEFLFSALPPGDYVLRASAARFRLLQGSDVSVAVGRTTRLSPRLDRAGVKETVAVTARLLPELDSPVNADLSPASLLRLPQDGRRFQSLAALTPLVSAEGAAVVLNPEEESADDTGAGDTDYARLSVRAQDPSLNRYTWNGGDLSRHFDMGPRGGGALPFTVSEEAVREFAVRAVSEQGESVHGRAAGGAVHTVSRRGGDTLHGSLFFLLRNSAADASNPFSTVVHYKDGSPTAALVKPRDQREQFGGSIGGPLLRQTFGFVAAEGQRRSFPVESTPSDASFFLLSAVQRALLANRGVSSAAAAKGLSFLDSLTGPLDRSANEFALFPRVDFDGARSHGSLSWNHIRFSSPAGQTALPVVARGRGSIATYATHADTAGAAASVAAGRWLVAVRASYGRDASFSTAGNGLPQEPHTGPGGSAPEVALSDTFAFGNAAAAGPRRLPDERVGEGTVHATWNGRAHTVSVGVAMAAIDERIGAREANNGRYSYADLTSAGRAGSVVDFLTDYTFNANSYPNGGCPSIVSQPHVFCFSSFSQSFGSVAETRFHTGEWSAFAGDRWRVSSRLRLDAGVRYEWNRMPPAQHPNASLDAVFGGFAATGSLPSDTNNLAPHAGIAYAPASSTVVRVGYGFEFASIPGVVIQRALENTDVAASQTTLRISPRTTIDPSCTSYGTNFGYPATYACSPFGPLPAAGASWMFARDFQMPAVQTAEASVSQQLGRHTSASGSYVLALSRELTSTVDLNVAPSSSNVTFRIVRNGGETGARGGEEFHIPRYGARRTPAFGPVTGIVSDGNGTYGAMAFSLQHVSHTLTVQAMWTWSKSLDTVRTGGAARNENGRLDPFDPLYDRAASNFDHTHRVVATGVWQPAVPANAAWLRRVANGWSVSPVVLMQSGRPYSYNLSGGTELPGGRESLNGSGGANYLPSVGRNTLRLPWTESVDVRVAREFALRREMHLRLSADAFNLFNHVNVTTVEQRAFTVGDAGTDGVVPLTFQDAATRLAEGLGGRAFGTPVTSANSVTRERRLQAGLRLEW